MCSMYKLRCTVSGHENDVRSLAPLNFPEGAFVSGSRDVTARVWVRKDDDQGYQEGIVLGGHSSFVSAVCALPPENDHPNGLIATGSNDNFIHVYSLESPEPLYRLSGHSDNVCSLYAGKFGTLISGSWDFTARVWLKQKCVMVLKAHEAAVWGVAIMPESGLMLTASADKTIRLWKAGKCECTFTGHSDCVRDVAVLNSEEFLSCSNDFTIRQWSTVSRTCLRVYTGHSSFVYKLAVMPNGTDFVSCGEDRSVRFWSQGNLQQTIALPSQSVWSVCVLSNGDIVTGGSDAVIRVFTTSSERVASDAELQAYEEQLGASTIPAQIGDISTEDLLRPDALLTPGRHDGQTIMVRTDTCIEAHQWSESEQRWIKIGNVTGGTSDSQASTSGAKTHYQGKDYDFVFNVEIYEGKPPLKLPYNIGEDPWLAAHNFLENNNISQMFLDQVAGFIQQQTAGITLSSHQPPTFSDPFTGGSRYIPGGAGGETGPTSAADPFTGGTRYVPPGSASSTHSSEAKYFPESNYIFFDQFKLQPIFDKLREFNTTKVPGNQQVTDDQLKALEDLIQGQTATTPALLEVLWKMMQWPADTLLPVLDVLRLILRDSTANQMFCNASETGSRLVSYVCSILSQGTTASHAKNQLVIVRALCNTFHHESGERLILDCGERLLAMSKVVLQQSTDKLLQVACASFVLNLIIGYRRRSADNGTQTCLLAAVDLADQVTEAEAQFRLVVAIGTAISNKRRFRELTMSLNISKFLKSCQQCDVEKLKLSAEKLQELLAN